MLREKLLVVFVFCCGLSVFGQYTLSMDGNDPSCFGFTNGTVSATPNGGTAPFFYIWDNALSGQTIMGVGAGTYVVTATDATGATATGSYTINNPPMLQFDFQVDDICAGDGNATGIASGGVAPYTYAWDDGQTGENATGLSPGQHCATVTDANGCQTAACEIIYAQLTVEVLTSDLNCFTDCDASVTAVVMGGFGPYTFLWNVGGTTQILENQPAGFYSVTVTDANGCTATGNNSIGSPTSLDVTVTVTNPPCGSGGTGTATVTASGGIPPYQYWWSTGATTTTVTDLPPGDYQVVVTDAHGCQTAEGFTIVEDGDIVINLVPTPTSDCGTEDGTATVTASGGTPPYSYEWNNGSTNMTITDLAPGTYTVTVNDSNGCNAVASVDVGGSPDVEVMLTGGDVSCDSGNDGFAAAVGFAGTPPYTYLWDNGVTTPVNPDLSPGVYTVTVTDSKDCTVSGSVTVGGAPVLDILISGFDPNCVGESSGSVNASPVGGTPPYDIIWSTGATTNTVASLPAGTYSVTITDDQGCSATSSVTLNDPPAISISIDPINASCPGVNNGGATTSISGGTPPYSYDWSNGQSGASLNNVVSGTYSVTVSDSEGCTAESSVTIGNDYNIDISTSSTASCESSSNGSATANASGGSPPYSYSWSNGASGSGISNVPAGTYTVTVTDAEGCEDSATVIVAEVENPTCTIEITTPISTTGAEDGEITANPSDGTPPYTYTWNNGQTSQTATGLGAGTYTVTITDANDCTSTCSITLEDPAKLGDFAWIDLNRDGCQDPDEPGIHDIEIQLSGYDNQGNLIVRYATTDLLGFYLFEGLPPGEYRIFVQDIPTGFVFTQLDACGEASDSDIDPNDGFSGNVNLAAGQCYLDMDIGIHLKCDNITNPGEIEGDETLCGPGFDAGPITEVSPPTGGYGDLEIIWMMSTEGGPFNPNTWTIIPGATGHEYDPGVLYETTYFARCARRECCNTYLETNIVTKTVDAAATAVIEGPELVCVGDVVTYSAADAGPNATYSWNFGFSANPSTSNQQIVNVVFNSFGVVNITLDVEANGCLATTALAIFVTDSPPLCGNPIIINAGPMPNGEVKIEWEMEAIPGDWEFTIFRSKHSTDFDEIGYVAQTENSGIAQYYFMDNRPERGTSYYKIRVEDDTGTHFAESNVVSTSLFPYHRRFMVYPNPVEEQLIIDIDESISTDIELEIFSPLGKQFSMGTIDHQSIQHQVELSDLEQGVYFVRLKYGDDEEEVFRIVKR